MPARLAHWHFKLYPGAVQKETVPVTLTNEIQSALRQQRHGGASTAKLTYIDLTDGETTENYFVVGFRSDFSSIFDFTATALLAIDEHMCGPVSIDAVGTEWADLEAHTCEAKSWMKEYNPTMQPGKFACFPSAEVLGFAPPANLERKLFLQPKLSGTEECFVCENADSYAFLYWHTTG